MKYLLNICFIIVLINCTRDENISTQKSLTDGVYWGAFNYDSIHLADFLLIKKDSFFEAPGNSFEKHFWCLTKGKYEIYQDSIFFNDAQIRWPLSYFECDEDWLLSGSYLLNELTDSIISFSTSKIHGNQSYFFYRMSISE